MWEIKPVVTIIHLAGGVSDRNYAWLWFLYVYGCVRLRLCEREGEKKSLANCWDRQVMHLCRRRCRVSCREEERQTVVQHSPCSPTQSLFNKALVIETRYTATCQCGSSLSFACCCVCRTWKGSRIDGKTWECCELDLRSIQPLGQERESIWNLKPNHRQRSDLWHN